MPEPSAPVLVGCGEVTGLTTPVEQGRSPVALIAQAGRLALADAGGNGIAQAIDTMAMLRLFADTSHRFGTKVGSSANPPKSVADRLGLRPARNIYTWNGGNMPQYLVNLFAQAIARGEIRAERIGGGEAVRTQHGVERAGLPVSWHEDPGGASELIGDPRRGWNEEEDRHNLRAAISFYPLFENAIRGARGRSIDRHMQAMGRLSPRFPPSPPQTPLAPPREANPSRPLPASLPRTP